MLYKSLEAAFSAAPSSDLARVVGLGYLDLKQKDSASTYLQKIDLPLDDEQAAELTEKMIQAGFADLGVVK